MTKKQDAVWNDYYSPFLGGNRFKPNAARNREYMHELMYVDLFTETAATRFRWINLPDTIPERTMEQWLFGKGLVVFFYDPAIGYLALPAAARGQLDMYGDPISYSVLAANGIYNKEVATVNSDVAKGTLLTPENALTGVPIWGNYNRRPDWDVVMLYATKLATIDRTIEINAEQARRTKVLLLDEAMKLTGYNIAAEIEAGASTIYVRNYIDIASVVQALDLDVDVKDISDIHVLKVRLQNECMGYLGINNSNQDKKERLVEAEVSANDEQVLAIREGKLKARKEACAIINRVFPDLPNGKIDVEYFNDQYDIGEEDYEDGEGVEPNGNNDDASGARSNQAGDDTTS